MKNLTTLKELEAFCKENGLVFVKGEKNGFIINLNQNIFISKELCCGGYHEMTFKVDQYDDNKIVVAKQSLDELDGYMKLETRTYGNVLATFLYDYNTTLLIFRKGNYWQECTEFYLADGDRDNGKCNL